MKRLFRNGLGTIAALALIMGLAGCDSMVYDEATDCYTVRFVYDYNMKYADATAHEVETITLHLVDPETGRIVLSRTESGEALAKAGYTMKLDVAPGVYTLLVWAGSEPVHNSFDIDAYPTNKAQLTATLLNREHDAEGVAHHRIQMDRLYYGRLDSQVFPEKKADFTVHMMKDTNELQIVLQHLSGEPLDPDAFEFVVVDDNARYDSDNNPLEDETITYHAWSVNGGIVNREETTRTQTSFEALVAEFTLPRLLVANQQTSRLQVFRRSDGDKLIDIPLIQALLLVKGYYNNRMSDQEFLDRQDDYSITFFLDDRDRWIDTYIYVLSWRVIWNAGSSLQ